MPHIHEKIDFTVEVYIVYKDAVLLRKHDKYNIWLSVGGHIELDEDPNQAALREVKEEVGLDVHIPVPKKGWDDEESTELITTKGMYRHRINDSHEHVASVYFATSESNAVEQPKGQEMECHWFTLAELDDPRYDLLPRVRYYAANALNELGDSG